MGLDFIQSEASWSYRGFMDFRNGLGIEIGIDLGEMAGFSGVKPWDAVEDDIVPFLNHSDCDGELSPNDCAKVAPRLRELVAEWPDGYDRRNALILANDMERCAAADEALIFC